MTSRRPDRKALLRARGVQLKDFAAELGVSKSHVTRVVAGERRSPRLERAIAKRLRMPLREAFPEWYGERAA